MKYAERNAQFFYEYKYFQHTYSQQWQPLFFNLNVIKSKKKSFKILFLMVFLG